MTGRNEHCSGRQDTALWYVAGLLDTHEHADFQQHLAHGCPQCREHITEANELIHRMPLALKPCIAPIGAKSRLRSMMKTQTSNSPEITPHTNLRPTTTEPLLYKLRQWCSLRYTLAISSTLALLTAATFHALNPNQPAPPAPIAHASTPTPTINHTDDLPNNTPPIIHTPKQFTTNASPLPHDDYSTFMLDILCSDAANIVSLTGPKPGSSEWGRLFWNPKKTFALLYLNAMPGPDENNGYQLWFVTDLGSILRGGEVSPDNGWHAVNVPESNVNIVQSIISYRSNDPSLEPDTPLLSGRVVALSNANHPAE